MIRVNLRHPTPEEIDSFVRAARRERARVVGRLLRAAVQGTGATIARVMPSDISSEKEHPMSDSFWRTAAESLPPLVRWRYAGLFEAAERYELLFDLVATSGGRARRALAQACRGVADALRGAARKLDVAAHRLMPMR
jgi:hypothetical protein